MPCLQGSEQVLDLYPGFLQLKQVIIDCPGAGVALQACQVDYIKIRQVSTRADKVRIKFTKVSSIQSSKQV
jgi:hypothetical protein